MKFMLMALAFMLANTVCAQGYRTQMTVAQDGSGDFTSIQEAIYATKTFPWEPIKIFIKNGVYKEKVNVFSWNTHLSLIGESRDGTIITFDDHFEKINKGRNSTFHTFTLRVAGNDFYAENLTIINSSGPVGQAVALHVEADRAAFLNVSLKGYQDTLYVAGESHRSYFKDCTIEGSIDFIFGEGTALFEDCEIKSLLNGYVTAASTPKDEPFGLVFNRCNLTAAPGIDQVYLGRPWRQHAKTVFLNTNMGAHILPTGWDNWSNPANEKTVFYAEHGSAGAEHASGKRVAWAKSLGKKQLKKYSIDRIFRGWRPIP